MSTGKRLRRERDRLKLSQAEFALRSGVARNTIVRYEKDKTRPGTDFIEAIRAIGVDVGYVLFNISNDEIVDCPYAAAKFAGGPDNIWAPVTITQCRDMASGVTLIQLGNNSTTREWFDFCQVCALHPGKLGNRLTALQDEDVDLLTAILGGIEESIQEKQLVILPAKKAQATAMLYRAFKASGKVDPAMIEEAVKLAIL